MAVEVVISLLLALPLLPHHSILIIIRIPLLHLPNTVIEATESRSEVDHLHRSISAPTNAVVREEPI